MALKVNKAGLQTTLQGTPFLGHRHIGMPMAGPADPLSLALGNRLLNQPTDSCGIEITLSGAEFEAVTDMTLAVTGAASGVLVNSAARKLHQSFPVKKGDKISVLPAKLGCRSYLTCYGGLVSKSLLNGNSTYLPAKLGGHNGRALQDGDILEIGHLGGTKPESHQETPDDLRPHFGQSSILRIVVGPEFSLLDSPSRQSLTSSFFKIGARSNRMGTALNGGALASNDEGQMQSAATFPGTIQLPASGQPFLLGVDAQTTGGYPRIAQVIRADRHQIGQLRSGSQIRFILNDPEQAQSIYAAKIAVLRDWAADIVLY